MHKKEFSPFPGLIVSGGSGTALKPLHVRYKGEARIKYFCASLLYGKGDYSKSICMAVETGFDTDCNGATVGSIFGMTHGADSVPEEWTKPLNNTLETSIFGVGTVRITDRVEKTLEQIEKIKA